MGKIAIGARSAAVGETRFGAECQRAQRVARRDAPRAAPSGDMRLRIEYPPGISRQSGNYRRGGSSVKHKNEINVW